jgi:AcrR family transcriptional regulator
MLTYHFRSRDGLVIAAMDQVRSRFQASHEAAFAAPRARAVHPLLVFWNFLTSSANLPYVRLLFEVQILALQNPRDYARYLDQTSASWLDVIERALAPAIRSRKTATLFSALVDGLLLDVLSTGDRRRATEALVLFLNSLYRPRRLAGTGNRARTRAR